jgi:hypothetical protein
MPQIPVEIAVLDEPEASELGNLVVGMFKLANWPASISVCLTQLRSASAE